MAIIRKKANTRNWVINHFQINSQVWVLLAKNNVTNDEKCVTIINKLQENTLTYGAQEFWIVSQRRLCDKIRKLRGCKVLINLRAKQKKKEIFLKDQRSVINYCHNYIRYKVLKKYMSYTIKTNPKTSEL